MTPEQYKQATFGPVAGSAGRAAAQNPTGYGDWAASLPYSQQKSIGNILSNSSNQAGPFGQGINTSQGMNVGMNSNTSNPWSQDQIDYGNSLADTDMSQLSTAELQGVNQGYQNLGGGEQAFGDGTQNIGQEGLGFDPSADPGVDWANGLGMAKDIAGIFGGINTAVMQYKGLGLAKDQIENQKTAYNNNNNRKNASIAGVQKAFG